MFNELRAAFLEAIKKVTNKKIKTKTTTLILLIAVSIARANLIDLTPGGFMPSQGFPPEFLHFINQQANGQIAFFDSATPKGWVSMFGALNGGTFFFTDLIGNPGPSAGVSWDFTTLPGWSMSVLLVEGEGWANLYGVPGRFRIVDLGDEVTLHDVLDIMSLAFYGRTPNSPVPDTGATFTLMASSLLGLFFYARHVHP